MEFMLAKEFTPNMKLPKKIKDTPPPIGWYMSEKLDGYRARYDPNTMSFVSRQNKPFHSPIWFTEFIGEYDLDGELFSILPFSKGMTSSILLKKLKGRLPLLRNESFDLLHPSATNTIIQIVRFRWLATSRFGCLETGLS